MSYLYALVPVALGAFLGLLPPVRRAVAAARFFAIGVAVAVVALVLLPEAVEAGGPGTLAAFAAGVGAPFAIEGLAHRVLGHEAHAGWLFWAALAVHQAVDGAGIGWAVRSGTAPEGVALAVAAHTVPLVAVAVAGGARSHPLACTLLLLTATAAGVAAVDALPSFLFLRGKGWIVATVAGLLIHVLGHRHETERDAPHR